MSFALHTARTREKTQALSVFYIMITMGVPVPDASDYYIEHNRILVLLGTLSATRA
jgi:hypothetical protein